MRFAKRVFTAAGVYGLVVLTPMLFVEHQVAAPAARLDHPEYFYGFLLIAIAAQVLFLLIGRDPVGLRPAMIFAVLEKVPFGATALVLAQQGRAGGALVVFSGIDIALGVLFAIAWFRTPSV